jgi:outer membrane translocation and assembly module TamA
VFGRGVVHGSFEYAHPVGGRAGGSLSIAEFVDVGRAWHRMDGLEPSPVFVDAGVGLRLHLFGGSGGTVRLDVAHGLRGGGTALGASWARAWPR